MQIKEKIMHATRANRMAGISPSVTFGQWLDAQLIRLRMDRAELADSAKLGRSTITVLINGKPTGEVIQPSIETVDKIAHALGVPRTIARMAAGYQDPNRDIDLEFCAEIGSILNSLSEEQRAPLKEQLTMTAHNWLRYAAAAAA
jgi:transcriptional regulator with XRE-family HTH domain